jgi:riboflavin kinase
MIFSGKGEGKYYVSLPGYEKQFKEILGITPFSGTLNVRVNPNDGQEFVSLLEPIKISGFKTEDRDFGPLIAYKIKIEGLDGFIIHPEKSHYKSDVIEILSDKYLRKTLHLKDKDKVTIKGEG